MKYAEVHLKYCKITLVISIEARIFFPYFVDSFVTKQCMTVIRMMKYLKFVKLANCYCIFVAVLKIIPKMVPIGRLSRIGKLSIQIYNFTLQSPQANQLLNNFTFQFEVTFSYKLSSDHAKDGLKSSWFNEAVLICRTSYWYTGQQNDFVGLCGSVGTVDLTNLDILS